MRNPVQAPSNSHAPPVDWQGYASSAGRDTLRELVWDRQAPCSGVADVAIRGLTQSIQRLFAAADGHDRVQVTFGTIASGDEDVVRTERAIAVRAQTEVLWVAWEQCGGG